ncbi:plasmid mobilization protein [Flavobacterium sp.]|uniref:plasmid mobilization protein n=1 Tax=Flavobacterium sp. TaxID=239 RepID=UPI004034E24C
MKKQKQLTLFLEQAGVLSGTAIQQAEAKKAYRRAYMIEWKKTAKRKREVRIMLSEEEYAQIRKQAQYAGFKPTTYLRELALAADSGLVPRKDELLAILQKVRMARVREDSTALIEIETLLLQYLKA